MKIGDIALGMGNFINQRDQANGRTIGSLTGGAQGILPGDQPDTSGIPPELMAQRPKVPTWAKIAMVLTDGLRGYQGEDPMFAPMLERRQRDDEDWNRKVALEGVKARQALEAQRQKAMMPDWGYEQDNAGNVWQYDKRSGKFADKPSFVDQAPRQYFQDGRIVNVPNPYNTQSAAAQPDTYTDPDTGIKYRLKPGGNRNNQNDWQMMGGPTSSASGGFRR
jgi:hypothetical protein